MNKTDFKEDEVIFRLHHAVMLHPNLYTMRPYGNLSFDTRAYLSKHSQRRG